MPGLKKNKKLLLLLLPLLMGFALQATQYARAPVEYDYYVVYAKNADIALRPGVDLSPNGLTLIQNSTTQQGYYSLNLGRWAPGYVVNYTDAYRIVNRELFNIRMIGLNFSAASTGADNLRIWISNDTDNDGVGENWVKAWDGTTTVLSGNSYIYVKASSTYGNDGGVANVKIDVVVPETGIGISNGTPEISYTGAMMSWFTSIAF